MAYAFNIAQLQHRGRLITEDNPSRTFARMLIEDGARAFPAFVLDPESKNHGHVSPVAAGVCRDRFHSLFTGAHGEWMDGRGQMQLQPEKTDVWMRRVEDSASMIAHGQDPGPPHWMQTLEQEATPWPDYQNARSSSGPLSPFLRNKLAVSKTDALSRFFGSKIVRIAADKIAKLEPSAGQWKPEHPLTVVCCPPNSTWAVVKGTGVNCCTGKPPSYDQTQETFDTITECRAGAGATANWFNIGSTTGQLYNGGGSFFNADFGGPDGVGSVTSSRLDAPVAHVYSYEAEGADGSAAEGIDDQLAEGEDGGAPAGLELLAGAGADALHHLL